MGSNRKVLGTRASVAIPPTFRLDAVRGLSDFLNRKAYIPLILPSFLFYTVFWVLPVLGAIGISFFEWNGLSINTLKWIGLGNYIQLSQDRFFWIALKNNGILVASTVLVKCTLALALAIVLDSGLRAGGFFRDVFFVPTVLSMIVVGLLFQLVLSPAVGLVAPMFRSVGLTSLETVQWLGDKRTALYSVLAVFIWKGFGFSMFLFLAGLQSIPREIPEAAKMDGAGPLKGLWYVIVPMLREVTIVVVIMAVINAFSVFDLIYIMTWGGPYHASEVLTSYMYTLAFGSGKMGYGTAIAQVLFIIILLATAIQLRIARAGTTEY